jgi:hypothetical protein
MRDATQALLVIDVQNDFCPGGALAVPGGDEIVPGINALMAEFACVILTQDWHPADHLSFASQHDGKAPMEMTEMPYGPQVLWPDHCVQGSTGRLPPRSRHHPRRPHHPQGLPPRDRQLFRLFRKRPDHADRARRLSQHARPHAADPRRPRHGFLRELLRRRRRASRVRRRDARRPHPRHRLRRVSRRGERGMEEAGVALT